MRKLLLPLAAILLLTTCKKTEPGLVTITTTAASAITSTTATSGGNITSDGGAEITERGICFNTATNPTTSNSKVVSGSGIGNFTANLSGLTAGTTYYVRAYAISSAGTSYGNVVTFFTYQEVMIGTQIWMLKNLDVSTYRNGDPIPQVNDPTAWAALFTGGWCWYNNDSATYATTYGKLYNWYAVNDPRGLAPTGWHVPSAAEWATLSTFLGGDAVAGGAMKETGTTHWLAPNTEATNSSGFTGLPGGDRYFNGVFLDLGTHGLWWSSTEIDIPYAKYSLLNWGFGEIFRLDNEKQRGFSVHCIKD